MRVLIGPEGESALHALYAVESTPWLRVNFVATLDGSAQGDDGLSGSINNEADHQVFAVLRDLADCLIVGAGTVRAEGYQPPTRPSGSVLPLVLVSRQADVPASVRGGEPGQVMLATVAEAPGLEEARQLLGADNVLVTPGPGVDCAALRAWLIERGYQSLLSEGGPEIFSAMLASGVVDELCLSIVPLLVAGPGKRIAHGDGVRLEATPRLLLEEGGTLLGRWFVR